ncbi:TPA: conjugative transfer system coupling protein TraD, partial [Legionella pneumophila subsp. pneumophila]|nr:conjugative transfer system coupling protein TraD [Legionella pneumophila subsp. pneumophila]
MSNYPINNLLREPTEAWSAITCLSLSLLAYTQPHLFLLTQTMGLYAALALLIPGTYRAWQAIKVKRYHRRLLAMPTYALSTTQIPLSKNWLFLGKGFRWRPSHTQKLHQIKQVKNEKFMQRSYCYQLARRFCQNHEHTKLAKWLNTNSKLNPFRPDPPVGGSPFLHGVGEEDKPVYIPQDVRVGHTFVVGTTQVGKTRLASILINQDIRNGEAVIVVDPKGDQDLVRDMIAACKASGRIEDFKIVHLGFPEQSAQYNPLKNFDQISEVATRITDAISAEGEGKQFAAFAWKYVNIVAICLEEMNQPITYQTIAFYISRLEQLLMSYADKILPNHYPNYHQEIDDIIDEHDSKIGKNNKTKSPMERHQAVIQYVKDHINKTIKSNNAEALHDQILIDLYDAAIMDKHYYDKITASVGPVLSEINKSNASKILSSKVQPNEIELMDV